ncbi:non-ribosomal peptide synthetase, partial [Chitinophaga japonensis]
MQALTLLNKLRVYGIKIYRQNAELKLHAPEGKMTPELLEEIRLYREDLLDLLEMARQTTTVIGSAAESEDYPVSSQQKAIWIVCQGAGAGSAYNMPLLLRLDRQVHLPALEKALQQVVKRHEVFRTAFFQHESGEIRQRLEEIVFHIGRREMTGWTQAQWEQELLEESMRPFDLQRAPLLRATLLYQPGGNSYLQLTIHHMICDGASLEILKRELVGAYEAERSGRTALFPPPALTPRDVAVWEQQRIAEQGWKREAGFWKSTLEEDWPVLQLRDGARPAIKTSAGKHLQFQLPQTAAGFLEAFCSRRRVSFFSGLLAALNVLFYRYTGNSDVVTGTVSAGREHGGLEKLVGLFINPLVIRTAVSPGDTFEQLLQHQQKVLNDAFAHQEIPFAYLVELLGKRRDISRSALFDIMVIYNDHRQDAPLDEESSHIIPLHEDPRTTSQFDITFSFHVTGQGTGLDITFNTDIYEEAMIRRLVTHYGSLLTHLQAHAADPVGRVTYLSPSEQEQLLQGFNNTGAAMETGLTLVDLFNRQVASRGDLPALLFKERSFSFRELDTLSGQLARYLVRQYDLQPGNLVGVMLPRSEWMIISLLAVLKTGCAYVPVDPAYPPERVEYIKADSGCRVCLDEQELQRFLAVKDAYPAAAWQATVHERDLAYVIYTSGSTGKPKGCMLEHRGVVNRIGWMWRHYGFGNDDVVLQKTTFTFDVSVWEIFMPLCWGCSMVLCEEHDVYAPARIAALISRHGVTCLHFVPGMLDAFVDVWLGAPENIAALSSLRRVITSGEALRLTTVRNWYSRLQVPLANLYGPTETSIDVTYFDTHPGITGVPIGKPVANTRLYILDKEQQLLPVGIGGELYVGGVQLARGYLNRPELTAERFIPSPFSNGERLYRTGDLARWLPDGNIEYLGRADDQVKIRGFRVELGELEFALRQLEGIDQAVAAVYEAGNGTRELAAYISGQRKYTIRELKQSLQQKLPEYMLPAYLVQVDQWPLTSSGKIDRKGLPSPATIHTETTFIPPRNAAERQVAHAWQQVLNREQVSVQDHFFDTGGDSIKAIRLLAILKKTFNREIGIYELYLHGTIEQLAAYLLENAGGMQDQRLRSQLEEQVEELQQEVLAVHPQADAIAAVYPMSDIQKGMLFGSQVSQDLAVYHEQFIYQLHYHSFDEEVFTKAFSLLTQKHETLRTGFDLSGYREPVQVVWKTVPVKIAYIDISASTESEQEDIINTYMREERERPFDFREAPLWRVRLFRCSGQRLIYLLQFHHAILDGWSVASLNTELHHVYNTLQQRPGFSPLPLQCTNRDAILDALLVKQRKAGAAFWKNELAGYRRLDIFSPVSTLETYRQSYDAAYLDRLKAVAGEHRVPVKHLCFAAYLYALQMLTCEEELTIGMVSNTRPVQEDGDRLLGCFLNTLPVRMHMPGGNGVTWRQYLEYVDARLSRLKQYDRTTLPDIAGMTGETGGLYNPFYDVMFNYIDFHVYEQVDRERQLPENGRLLSLSSHEVANAYLAVDINVTGNRLQVSYTLTRELKSGALLPELHTYFNNVLEACAVAADQPVSRNSILPPATQQQLLVAFNSTASAYPDKSTLTDLFEEWVKRCPDSPALVHEGQTVSYRELDSRSNQLARYLRRLGAGNGNPVPVCLARSAELVISMLAVLKAGGAYVPVDPAYPEERIAYMLSDAGSNLLLTSSSYPELAEGPGNRRLVQVDIDWPMVAGEEATPLLLPLQPADPAYIIYTSGSTGRPKGVIIPHTAMVNLVHWHIGRYEVTPGARSTAMAGVGFDAFALETWSALLSGATLYIVGDEQKLDPEELLAFYDQHRITHAFVPPALIPGLVNCEQPAGMALKYVLIGGDRLPEVDISRLSYTLVNQYGPTESTVMVTDHPIYELTGKQPPIGKPLANTTLYVLDGNRQLLPVGVPGELYIGGVQLAKGYLNKPDLTAAKFVPDPYKEGERLYRSGDLCRWLSDGNLEYIGRIDDQVKIRGYRIEPGEVEHALEQLQGVTAAVVTPLADQEGQRCLVGYFTGEQQLDISNMRQHLLERLPAYMVPAWLVQLDCFPLTANGKVDKGALPPVTLPPAGMDTAFAAPGNSMEMVLAEVYGNVLGRSSISIKQNFFELGGDSIKAILLTNRLRQRGYSLKVGDVLKYPVLEELAVHVARAAFTVPQHEVSGRAPLTPVQHWLLNSSYACKHHYNQSVLLRSSKPLNAGILRQCLTTLTNHHDALRMTYQLAEGEWHQYNRPVGEPCYTLLEYDLREDTAPVLQMERLGNGLQASIHLETGPLLKAGLFRMPDGDRLLLIIHHLVTDGISWRILLEDLSLLYSSLENGAAAALPLKSTSFLDWSVKLQAYAGSNALEQELPYWQSMQGADHALPLDHPGGGNQLADNDSCSFELDRTLTDLLTSGINNVYNTDTNDILLTALALAARSSFGQPALLVELEGHGREELLEGVDIGRTVGWFTSTYPLLFRLPAGGDAAACLVAIKEQLRGVPGKGMGYGLLRYLSQGGKERLGALPSGRILFNYLGDFGAGLKDPAGEALFTFDADHQGAVMDGSCEQEAVLSVVGILVAGTLRITVSYSRLQYEAATIQQLVQGYEAQLKELIAHLHASPRRYLTPGDVTFRGLDMKELEAICSAGEVADIYALSPLQEGIYYHWLSDPGSPAYVEQTAYRVRGILDAGVMGKSYEYLVARHAVLRTSFSHEYGSGNLQIVRKQVQAGFIYQDISNLEDKEAYVTHYKQQDRKKGFDLRSGSQMRLSVLDLGAGEYEFVWSHHHILMDGWCTAILIGECYSIYGALINDRPVVLEHVQPYVHYINWLSRLDTSRSLQYWRNYLGGYESLAGIPFKESAREGAPYILKEACLSLDAGRFSAIQDFCRRLGVTEGTFIQAAWAYLLSCYNHTQDVVFGAVVSGRPGELDGVETMIGLFINTIPVRVRYNDATTVKALLQQVQEQFIEGLPHHYARLSEVQAQSVLGNKLFDHPVAYLNHPVQTMLSEGIEGKQGLEGLQLLSTTIVNQPNYDFNVIAAPAGGGISIVFRYNGACYPDDAVDRVKEHFANVMEAFVTSADSELSQVTWLPAGERHQLLYEFNDTGSPYPDAQSIPDLFAGWVERVGDSAALVHEGRTLSYRELDEQSNQLAHYLQRQGVGEGSVVPVLLDRSLELVLSLLAVLKAGGAYVPVDPAYPAERISYMLSDTGSRLLLTHSYYTDLLEDHASVQQVCIDRDWSLVQAGEVAAPGVGPSSSSLAYVIYTSGSTGQPKGV